MSNTIDFDADAGHPPTIMVDAARAIKAECDWVDEVHRIRGRRFDVIADGDATVARMEDVEHVLFEEGIVANKIRRGGLRITVRLADLDNDPTEVMVKAGDGAAYGCIIPALAAYEIRSNGHSNVTIYFNEADDESDMRSWSAERAEHSGKNDLDSGVYLDPTGDGYIRFEERRSL